MGCTSSLSEKVACMRKVAGEIETVVCQHVDSVASPTLYFAYQYDGKLGFRTEDYRRKTAAGQFANVPVITDSNYQEASSLITPCDASGSDTTPALIHGDMLAAFQCMIATKFKIRQTGNRTPLRCSTEKNSSGSLRHHSQRLTVSPNYS